MEAFTFLSVLLATFSRSTATRAVFFSCEFYFMDINIYMYTPPCVISV